MQAASPVAEIGEGNHTFATDAHHLIEDAVREVYSLQGVRHDHHIETLVGEIGQALIQILLNNAESPGNAGGNVILVDLQSHASYLAFVLQKLQKLAIATGQIQNPGTGGYPAFYMGEVGAHQRFSSTRVM